MAELTVTETTADACCAPEQQATCCEPSAKAECCGHDERCGCDAASDTTPPDDVREQVRERYAAAARAATDTEQAGCGCATSLSDEHGREVFGGTLYDEQDTEGALTAAGLIDVEIRETHSVHEHASAAIIRAHKPAPAA